MSSYGRKIEGFLTLDISDFSRKMSIVDNHLSSSSKNFGQFNNTLSDTSTKSKKASKDLDNVSNSSNKSATGMRLLNKETHNLKRSFGLLGIAGGVIGGLIGFELVNSFATVATESINADANIKKMANGMKWSAQQTQSYINKMNQLQRVYKKIDMRNVAAETATIARMYKLSNQEATAALEPIAVLNDAFIREGRTTTDAALAVKDLVDQGAGWQRRLSEIGVTEQNLTAAGWSGKKDDKVGMLNALAKVEEQRSLTGMAKEVQTLDDAWQVLSISIGQTIADVIIPLTPTIVAASLAFSGFTYWIKDTVHWLQGLWAALPGGAQVAIIGTVLTLVAGAIFAFVIPALTGFSGTIMTMVVPALYAMASATLFNPFFWIALAIVGVIAVVYELGKVWGWWTDLSSMGAAVWSGLVNVFNYVSGALQSLWGVMSGFIGWVGGVATNVWNALTSSFYDSDGKFVGLIQGFQNLGGLIWTAIQPGLYAIPGQLWGFFTSLPGIIYNALLAQAQGNNQIATAVIGWFSSIDWMGVLRTGLSALVAINPITLITRLLFGDKASDAASTFAVNSIMGFSSSIGSFLSGLYSAIAPVASSIVSALAPIICVIVGCSPGIIPALQSLYSWFTSIFGNIWSFIGPIAGIITNGLSGIWGALSQGDIGGAIMAGFSTLQNIGTYVMGFLLGIDWSGLLTATMTTIAGFLAQNNPVTWIATLIFGPGAGSQVSSLIFTTLTIIGTTFITGLQMVWNGLNIMVSFALGIWNRLILGTQIAWALLNIYILNPARLIWATLNVIWNSIWGTINGVWSRLHSGAVSTFNAIKSAILNPFNTVKSILTTVWNGLKSGWNTMVSVFGSGATRLKNLVLSPIRTVYNGLVDLWNLVTGSKTPHMAGGAGPSTGKAGNAGPSGFAGPSTTTPRKGSKSKGLWAGFTDTVRDHINLTANYNGLRGRFAGPSTSAGLGDGPKDNECDPNEPCYAGWGDVSNWSSKIKSVLTSWPTKATIGGIKVTQDLMNSIMHGGGKLAIFEAVANKIFSGINYEYYYNNRYTDAQVLSGHKANCWDSAELLMNLGARLNLPVSMGHGTWGKDGHVWAIIAGKIFDGAAKTLGYGWKSPKVKGYSAGPRPSAGPTGITTLEYHAHFDMSDSQFKDDDSLIAKVKKAAKQGAEEVFAEFLNPDKAHGG